MTRLRLRLRLRLPLPLPQQWVLWPGLAAAVSVAGIAALAMMPAPQAIAAVASQPLPVARAATARDRSCAECGYLQAIRRTDTASGEPAYEFSVRMRDGSIRASTGATVGGWVQGDRVMLIGGPAARAREEQATAAL